jgi:hypothetical protein
MGRNRAAPASKPAAPAAAPRASAPPPARTAQPAASSNNSTHQSAHQQAPPQPQVTHVVHHHAAPMGGGMGMGMAPRGPGLMGTMAAAAAGSIAGNYIASQWAGASASELPRENPQLTAQQANELTQAVRANDPCKAYFESYSKCLEVNNPGDAASAASCNWAWDLITKCRSQNGL